MIVVRISGGLGNQMFQYAFARALQARGREVCLHWHNHRSKNQHNGFELDRVFRKCLSGQIPLASQSSTNRWRAWSLRKTLRIREKRELQFQPHLLETEKGYLDGYWQTESYFNDHADFIRRDFSFRELEGAGNREIQKALRSGDFCSVHLRRGDYVKHPELGGICSDAYYRRALDELRNRIGAPLQLVCFSDDIPYCRTLFSDYDQPVVFCDWNQGLDSWMDMALMAQCRHHIIANSSFSWWGAWLGEKKGHIIAPSRWTNKTGVGPTDIIPPAWISL